MIIKYDENRNPYVYSKHGVKQTKKWRQETAEYFRKKYGSWYLFVGVSTHRSRKTWIERYRKKEV
tara:strand:+ start:612 stop:806 length:195 start_codon:yes stop_codon:yes gene_type:complete